MISQCSLPRARSWQVRLQAQGGPARPRERRQRKDTGRAMLIIRKNVADELGGQSPQKMHCSNLGADALQAAKT